MLAIEVELLTGRYVATAHDDRRQAEWPPHPARLFSALVAAHYEGALNPNERHALEWLERQPSPGLAVDTIFCGRRDVLDVFVPVNDVSPIGDLEHPLREKEATQARLIASGGAPEDLKKATKDVERAKKTLVENLRALEHADEKPSAKAKEEAEALLPERRLRQVRTFPVAIPSNPLFAFVWPEDPPAPIRSALERLCERVTRLGHSSSLVWCRLATREIAPNLVPREDGDLVLRTISAGQLERLDRAFDRHQGIQPGRELPSRPQRYGPPSLVTEQRPRSLFAPDDWIVFERVGGSRPMASKGVDLTRALRAALLEQHGVSGMPRALSGHEADGSPTKVPHLAFIALPFVGHQHADGSIQGYAIVPPRDLAGEDRELLLRLVAQWERVRARRSRLSLAAAGARPVEVERVELPTKESTRAARWARPSRRFVTVTPIALDRNPGNLRSNFEHTAKKAALEAERSIADACVNIGLVRPKEVRVSFTPFLRGAQPAPAFRPTQPRPGAPVRLRVHALIEFENEVEGPVLLGAGRHFGLGLCLPMEVSP